MDHAVIVESLVVSTPLLKVGMGGSRRRQRQRPLVSLSAGGMHPSNHIGALGSDSIRSDPIRTAGQPTMLLDWDQSLLPYYGENKRSTTRRPPSPVQQREAGSSGKPKLRNRERKKVRPTTNENPFGTLRAKFAEELRDVRSGFGQNT